MARAPRYERFRAHDGTVDRCRIAYTDARSVMTGTRVHFKENFFLCKQGRCCAILGLPKWRVSTVLVKYLRQSHTPDPDSYELFVWIFGRKTYMSLNELGVQNRDFNIHCEHEQYQMIRLELCRNSWANQLNIPQEKITELYEHGKRCLGLDLSEEEIDTLLQGTEPVASAPRQRIITPRLTTPPPELISIIPAIPAANSGILRIEKRRILW